MLDSLETDPPTTDLDPPADWPALRAKLRGLADDLMLCTDIPSALAKLAEDKVTFLGVVWLVTNINEADSIAAMKQAYSTAAGGFMDLPGSPFAAYVIALCDGLELTK